MPEKTLRAFAAHGAVESLMPADGGDSERVLAEFARAGVNTAAVAVALQSEGIATFASSWADLMACIAEKRAALA